MSGTGAAKVNTITGPIWCHYSRRANTLKLRRFSNGAVYEVDNADESDVEEWLPLSECKKIVKQQGDFSIKNCVLWSQILDLLNTGNRTSNTQHNTQQRVTVPVTRLRRYYSSMRLFEKAFFLAFADMYCKKPSLMETLWNQSRNQFLPYDNQDGWGQGDRKELPKFQGELSDVSKTDEFTSYLCGSRLAESDYTYVEREINPWRTRNGILPNNEAATKTGRGGMDLLLRSPEGRPVVGEVKVKDDWNCFFALLQAMTYAVELSTQNQFNRLRRTFPNYFAEIDVNNPTLEVAVILVNPVKDATRDVTIELVKKLNKRKRCGGLHRITVFKNSGDNWTTHK